MLAVSRTLHAKFRDDPDFARYDWSIPIVCFRLQAYNGSETKLFDRSDAGGEPLTLGRLGKLTAISLRWSSLLPELSRYPDLMRRLEKAALDVKAADDAAVRILRPQPKLRELLREGLEDVVTDPLDEDALGRNRFSLSKVDAALLLRTSARIVVPAPDPSATDVRAGERSPRR